MDLLSKLQSEFGDAVSSVAAAENDAVDGVQPQVVAAPRDEDAAQALVAWCGRENIAFVPRGGGTKLHIGAPPTRCDLVISTEKLTQIFDHDEGNATVQAGAGISLTELEKVTLKSGQVVPLSGAKIYLPTLGGTVATNYTELTSRKYGTPRDLVTGLHAVLSDGRLVKSGAKVVKNVAGYDLNKLFIGSFGTLGLITEVTLRLRPQVEKEVTWESFFTSWQEAENLAWEILNGPFEPTWLNVDWDGEKARLRMFLQGNEAAVSSQVDRLPPLRAGALRVGWHPLFMTQIRACLPLLNAPVWIGRLRELGLESLWWDCPFGVVCAGIPDAKSNLLPVLRAEAENLGGFLVVERAPVEVKTPDLVWGKPRGDFALMQKLKQSFDAANVCAPGRFIGGL